jgi:hypothetical protein
VDPGLVAGELGRLDDAVRLCLAGRDTFAALTSRPDEYWSLVVHARVMIAAGLDGDAQSSMDAARDLAREIGREDQ